jgi:hypothetical protein
MLLSIDLRRSFGACAALIVVLACGERGSEELLAPSASSSPPMSAGHGGTPPSAAAEGDTSGMASPSGPTAGSPSKDGAADASDAGGTIPEAGSGDGSANAPTSPIGGAGAAGEPSGAADGGAGSQAPAAAGHAAPPEPSAFPSVDRKWADRGPFEVAEMQSGRSHTLYYPTELGRAGLRHPIILWGNGSGTTPSMYAGLLRHWASHGFIVAAANTTNAGTGAEMLDGAMWLIQENSRAGSPFFAKVETSRIGASGHSQGGAGAITVGANPIVSTTVPIEPGRIRGAAKDLRGPMFIIGGAADTVVVPDMLVLPRYMEATQIEAICGVLDGATHLEPLGDGGGMRGYATAWFRLHLMADRSAREVFHGPACEICTDSMWTVQRNYE